MAERVCAYTRMSRPGATDCRHRLMLLTRRRLRLGQRLALPGPEPGLRVSGMQSQSWVVQAQRRYFRWHRLCSYSADIKLALEAPDTDADRPRSRRDPCGRPRRGSDPAVLVLEGAPPRERTHPPRRKYRRSTQAIQPRAPATSLSADLENKADEPTRRRLASSDASTRGSYREIVNDRTPAPIGQDSAAAPPRMPASGGTPPPSTND
jgi:hypothetical protein